MEGSVLLFNSLTFVVFFIVVLVGYHLPQSWRVKKTCLLIASYIFYAAWSPPFVILLWISTAVDWVAARKIAETEALAKRKVWVAVSMVSNLGMLGFFKYGGFLMDNFVDLAQMIGMSYTPAAFSIVLPVGISFYTFQTMSYTLDVYQRKSEPCPRFIDFALYVTFFPQLVAGPIVRATDLIPQFQEERRATGPEFSWGLGLMSWGLFQKVVLADTLLASAADSVFGTVAAPPLWTMAGSVYWVDAWLGTLAFAGQIFCDFAGYSTVAIGTALCLGFHIPENFRFPYAAIGFSDFWQRWHISLSAWLRDYLYIPLGGNRKGRAREYINVMITMLLGGLWHGASWMFVVWGGLHGLYLWMERVLRALFSQADWVKKPVVQGLLGIVTFLLVTLTWIFFRAQTWNVAWHVFLSALYIEPMGAMVLSTLDMVKVIVVMTALVASHWLLRNASIEELISRVPWWLGGIVWAALLLLTIIAQGGGSAFIYFQF
ncbi:MAG: alginate O-acetyltransferase complex protein AlgI [Candidatus Latescibacterota bacterium]